MKKGKRVLLAIKEDNSRADLQFEIQSDVPKFLGPASQSREHDKELGAGTMSRSGAMCPKCKAIVRMSELRARGRAGRLGTRMMAVVVDGQAGKEYRIPTEADLRAAIVDPNELLRLYHDIPFGMPANPTPRVGALGIRVGLYGFNSWEKLFISRQLLALGTLVREIRAVRSQMKSYPMEWREALIAYLACTFSKLADYSSTICSWDNGMEALRNTFSRFALPMVWDFCEVNPLSERTGGFAAMSEWAARYADHALVAVKNAPLPNVSIRSALNQQPGDLDLICTDPPYYDAIPYSDLMDFFYVWLRRVLHGLSDELDEAFSKPLGPKWDSATRDGELIDDASRFDGNRAASKQNYEDGMARAFVRFHEALRDDGRLVIVFANKSPKAWETLVSALIRAGFVVTGSWPIQTEMQNRQRAMASAALASSIWIICRKRPPTLPGWQSRVLEEMNKRIVTQLRSFWDEGIRGPDFVWSATGPALEAFSRYPVVKRADTPGSIMTVLEFLRYVRRAVVGFMAGKLMGRDDASTGDLDNLTTYYLLHRNDFGLAPAPAGACILYALSCSLSDRDLVGRYDLFSASGSTMRLKTWQQRKKRNLGLPNKDGISPALIDSVHKVMHLWLTGEQRRVDDYLDDLGLWKNALFHNVVQAVLEMSGPGERELLEKIQRHLRSDGKVVSTQGRFRL